MNFGYLDLIITISTTVVSVGITFYLKDFLQKRLEYKKLRSKLEAIAGKNATIVYTGVGANIGGNLYKIIDIDQNGVTLENRVQTIFLPPAKLLLSEMILPADNYKELKEDYEKKELERVSEAMFQPMFDKMKESFEHDLKADEGELSSTVEIKVIKTLKEQGIITQVSTAELKRLEQIASKA